MDYRVELKNFLDCEGRLIKYPSKHRAKIIALCYIADKIPFDREYSEKEINQMILENHTFNDITMLRRDMYERKLLNRERDGSRYRRELTAQEVMAKAGIGEVE